MGLTLHGSVNANNRATLFATSTQIEPAYVTDCLKHSETPYAGWSSDFPDLRRYLETVRDFCANCLASITEVDLDLGTCTNCGVKWEGAKFGQPDT